MSASTCRRRGAPCVRLWLLLALAAGAPASASGPRAGEQPELLPQPIVNGVLTWRDPSAALLATGRGLCSAVLVGCRTVLTAAHCVCPNLRAEGCVDDPDLADPALLELFFQHAGFFSVKRIAVPPDFVFDVGHDVAVLELETPVTGIRPVEIGGLPGTGIGVEVFFVGFGRDDSVASTSGIKRLGRGTTVECPTVPEATHVCTEYTEPVGEPGEDSSICLGDSGGPLFVGDRSSPLLVGVASGADQVLCRPPRGFYFAGRRSNLDRERLRPRPGGGDLLRPPRRRRAGGDDPPGRSHCGAGRPAARLQLRGSGGHPRAPGSGQR